MEKGKIIVLEGLDGSGKSTQLDLAYNFLVEQGIICRMISFPNYETITGQLVECYLRGEIPCEGDEGAYSASSMYAIDRYVSYVTDWKDFYEAGGVIISGRYTTSNAIYQLTKVTKDNREDFLNWLFDYEYNKLGLPKPDMVLFLDMPVEVSQRLLDDRYLGDPAKKDIHEKNVKFLNDCRHNALQIAERCNWDVIDCAKDGLPVPIEDIYIEICAYLRVLLFNERFKL